jgi:TonB-dependent receptor
MRYKNLNRGLSALASGASMAALVVAMAPAGSAWADSTANTAAAAGTTASTAQGAQDQSTSDQPASTVKEVIVVGVLPSLKTALSIKKNADTEVDSLSATDIGAFPDASIAEALQRVPGITVTRLQSADDSSHYSGEPASVLIRGLTFVRTEFNGEDSFSADASRGLNFNDVSPELVTGVDAYKNSTADMIEGGVGGTVDIRTRDPFDSNKQVFAVSAYGDYGSRSDRTTAEYSGLYSNVYNTPVGKFGILVDLAYSHIDTQTNEVDMTRIGAFCNGGDLDANNHAIITNGNVACTSNPFGGTGWAYAPEGINYSSVLYDRTRRGADIGLQYQSPDHTLLVTFRAIDSNYHNAWTEKSVEADLYTYNPGLYGDPGFAPQSTAYILPAQGTQFKFGPNGMLQSGTATLPPNTLFGSSSPQMSIQNGSVVAGEPFFNYCGAGTSCPDNGQQGVVIEDQSRIFDHTEDTQDYQFNVKWKPNDRLTSTFDFNYVTAWVHNYDVTTGLDTSADVALTTGSQGVPVMKILPDPNTNYAPGFTGNASNYWLNFVQDHFEKDYGQEYSARWDTEYKFDDGGWMGWLDSLKAGVRFADRHQQVDYSEYNWSNVVANWDGWGNGMGPGFSITNTTGTPMPGQTSNGFKGYGANITTIGNMNGFYGNGVVSGSQNFAFISQNVIQNYALLTQDVSQAATGTSPTGWNPIPNTRTGCPDPAQTQAQYGCYIPAEELNVDERTFAGYIEAKFGGPNTVIPIFGGISYSGNFGVRIVNTQETSNGGVAFPSSTWVTNLTNGGYTVPANLAAFSNGASSLQSYSASYVNVLPSFNIRFHIAKNQYVRFGASEGLSRPDMGSLRNYVGVAAPITTGITVANSATYNYVFQAQAGNAAVRPMTADQFDLTYENYFTPTSAFTVDFFYKALHNPITLGEAVRSFTNNGVTEPVLVQGPVNGGYNGGALAGFEVAYSSFFKFLPKPFDGLGVEANYTHTDEWGINNSNLVTDPVGNGGTGGSSSPVGGGNGENLANGVIDPHRLAGISNDSYNIIGLYEKGPFAFRLAYSWRSEFLVSNVDCCIGLPVWQRANGFLDASLHYKITDNLEAELDGKNLLDTTTIFAQQVQGDSPQTPGAKPILLNSAWVRADQAVKFGIRFKF